MFTRIFPPPGWMRLSFVLVMLGVLILGPGSTVIAAVSGDNVLYTLDAEFDQGTLANVNHDAPNNDQLQLNTVTEPFPFINVAASLRGTMVRIHTDTGQILGEYLTAPEGRGLDPSRTTVDLYGNVWTGNREEQEEIGNVEHGSVVKIGLITGGTRVEADGTPNPGGDYLAPPFGYNTCLDRDSDGLIKTSRGLDDIRPWPDGTDGAAHVAQVQDADDECILIYQRLYDAPNVRHVSVDANNDVWFSGLRHPWAGVQRMFHKLDGDTGAVLKSFDARPFGCGGYGGLIDGYGTLWSASSGNHGGGGLLRYDPATDTGECIQVIPSYGLGIDTNGYIWNSMYDLNTIVKVDPDGVIQSGFPKPTGGASDDRGVAVTPADNNVWVANSKGNNVSRLDNNGTLITTVVVGTTPTGVAVDAQGKVWVTNLNSNNAMRIDPATNNVDLTVPLGSGAGPYNYSDMTGIVIAETFPQGAWTVVQDCGPGDWDKATITWNTEDQGSEPPGTSLNVEMRTAETEAGLGGGSWTAVSNGVSSALIGQFIEAQVTFKPDEQGTSPILSDIRIQCKKKPTAISLASFEVEANDGRVVVLWETGTEIDNAGFNIYRAVSPDGPWVKVNNVLIAAEGDPVAGTSYTLVDTPGRGVFYYRLEDIDLSGVATLHEAVSAQLGPAVIAPWFRPVLPEF